MMNKDKAKSKRGILKAKVPAVRRSRRVLKQMISDHPDLRNVSQSINKATEELLLTFPDKSLDQVLEAVMLAQSLHGNRLQKLIDHAANVLMDSDDKAAGEASGQCPPPASLSTDESNQLSKKKATGTNDSEIKDSHAEDHVIAEASSTRKEENNQQLGNISPSQATSTSVETSTKFTDIYYQITKVDLTLTDDESQELELTNAALTSSLGASSYLPDANQGKPIIGTDDNLIASEDASSNLLVATDQGKSRIGSGENPIVIDSLSLNDEPTEDSKEKMKKKDMENTQNQDIGAKNKSCDKHPAKNAYRKRGQRERISMILKQFAESESEDEDSNLPSASSSLESLPTALVSHSSKQLNLNIEAAANSHIETGYSQCTSQDFNTIDCSANCAIDLTNLVTEQSDDKLGASFRSHQAGHIDKSESSSSEGCPQSVAAAGAVINFNGKVIDSNKKASVTITKDSENQLLGAILSLQSETSPNSSPQKRKLTLMQIKALLSNIETQIASEELSQESHKSSDEKPDSSSVRSEEDTSSSSCPTPTKRPCLLADCSYSSRDQTFFDAEEDVTDGVSSTVIPVSPDESKKRTSEALSLPCDVCGECSSQLCQCNEAHLICQGCLEKEVRTVMATDKMHLLCPATDCSQTIAIESTVMVLPTIVVDLLRQNIDKKQLEASSKAIDSMEGMVSCPICSYTCQMEENDIIFICRNDDCTMRCCRFCKNPVDNQEDNNKLHRFCSLLLSVGKDCLTNISIVPENWLMNLFDVDPTKIYCWNPIDRKSTEGKQLRKYFKNSLWDRRAKKKIVNIWRVQNKKLWERYVLKRIHMEQEIGEQKLSEKYLFHGTKHKNIFKIAEEGFDMRLPVANGHAYGKGIYFATSASYSLKYLDCKMMFIARVLCGISERGDTSYTRPPPAADGRLVDSCVDRPDSPWMYIVFDNCQVYPEILVEFE